MNIRSVKVSLHDVISGNENALRNNQWAGCARLMSIPFAADQLITVCGTSVALGAFLLPRQPPPDISRTFVLRGVGFVPYIAICCGWLAKRYCSISPPKLSASSVSDGFHSVFQTTSWLIVLTRCAYAPNAVLQQPFLARLAPPR